MTKLSLQAIRHVAFEDLGSFCSSCLVMLRAFKPECLPAVVAVRS